jgi:hypothetical protein
MKGKPENRNGRYLYAIVAGAEERVYGDIGIDGGVVYNVSNGRMSAVVSDLTNSKIRPERRHLAAHQNVLRCLMEKSTPLPMTFGIIADGPGEIVRILRSNRDAFLKQLQFVSNAVEMGLRVTCDVPNIFEYYVDIHPELRAARDQYLGRYREPTQEEKIIVGRMFERILKNDREEHTERVQAILQKHCLEIKRNSQRNETEVMNLACLVERGDLDDFEAAIFETAKLFDNNFAFDFNGPWAPHNFVRIDLKL